MFFDKWRVELSITENIFNKSVEYHAELACAIFEFQYHDILTIKYCSITIYIRILKLKSTE